MSLPPLANEEGWVSRDYGGDGKAVSLSRTSLGEFVYHLFRHGGRITSTYVMNPSYDRSYVQIAVVLPKGRKEAFESASGYALEKPPQLVPASQAGSLGIG